MDGLNRLTDAQWGTWGGASIGSEVRQRTWTLDQVGNWDFDKLDLEDDNDYTGAGEYNEDRTHNDPNELLGRDVDDNGSDNYTLTYNKRGDMTDDGQHYEYVYDAFGDCARSIVPTTRLWSSSTSTIRLASVAPGSTIRIRTEMWMAATSRSTSFTMSGGG